MGTTGMMQPLYVCVYVPEVPAQALLRHRPELEPKPVVVLGGEAPLEQVCSANRTALRLGVTRGMTRAELDTFTGLCVLRRSAAEERHARQAVMEIACGFTPRVEIQPSRNDVLIVVLDMTGTERIFGPASQAVQTITQRLQDLRLVVRVATSANLLASVCVAPSANTGPVFLAEGKEAEQMSALPLDALGLTPQQTERLDLWGLKMLGELAALPEVELVVRLGQEGKRLRLLARGEHPHLMVPEEPVFTLEEFVEFDTPVDLLDSLLFVLGPMLDHLLERAQNRSYALASVTVKLGLDGGGLHERTVKPALPVLQRDVLLKLLHLDLQAHPPPAGILSMFVQAEPGDRSKVQLGLFAPQLPEPSRLDVTLARIAVLVGEERVGSARLLDGHKPDSFVMEKFLVSNKTPNTERARQNVAVRRCRPPVAVQVRQQGHRLNEFTFRGRLYLVKEAYGPWRRSGQWWSAEVWSLEEWDISAANGAEKLLCILAYDLLKNQWQMAAFYD